MADETVNINSPPQWYQEIFPGGTQIGFYEKLVHHALLFVERSADVLIVSFDNLAEAGGRHMAREPWAGKFVADNGWSHLGIFASGPSWYRDAELIARLEALRDNGFFKRYDHVIFCGTSMGGFAALTFARLSPGAVVIAFSPQSTLAPDKVPWEVRFNKGRKQDWTLPYSDAANGLAEIKQAHVIYDPFVTLDSKHVDRLSSNAVMCLRAPGCGHKSAMALRRMDKLKSVMHSAIKGDLTPLSFARLIRNRKDIYLYKKVMQGHLLDRNREQLANRFNQAIKAHRRKMRS